MENTLLYKVGPPNDSVQLVNITSITVVYGTYDELVAGVYKPTYTWGAPHCSDMQNQWNING